MGARTCTMEYAYGSFRIFVGNILHLRYSHPAAGAKLYVWWAPLGDRDGVRARPYAFVAGEHNTILSVECSGTTGQVMQSDEHAAIVRLSIAPLP